MNPLFHYFGKSVGKSWITLLFIIVLPACMPYIFNAIIQQNVVQIDDLKSEPYELPPLPQLDKIAYAEKDFVYFSYAPKSLDYEKFVQTLLDKNNIKNAKILSFNSSEEAEHYFNVKNIVPKARAQFENKTFYNEILCKDFRQYFNNPILNCTPIDFSQNFEKIMKKTYNLSKDDLNLNPQNDPKYKDNILFHINFYVSHDKIINNVPLNITYEIVYNHTILDETIRRFPDPLSVKYGNNFLQPYWTGYSSTLQQQLDEITLENYTNLSFKQKFERVPELNKIPVPASMFFELICLLSFSLLFIFSTMLSSINRGPNHLILRRLGVKELPYWLFNFGSTFIPVFISSELCAIVWHFTGVLPFSAVTVDFAMFIMLLLSFLITSCACMLSCIFGKNQVIPVILSCLLSFFLMVMAGMIHAGAFSSKSLFDPSLVPQWGTWFSMAIMPPFSALGLMDAMTSTLKTAVRSSDLTQHQWVAEANQTPISYLFTNYENYTSAIQLCMIHDSKNGEMIAGQCIYHQPSYGLVIMLAALQALVVMPFFTLWISYVKSEKGFRGLPLFFFCQKSFWVKQKTLKPGKSSINISNLSVAFRKNKKKSNSDFKDAIFGNKNFALKHLNYSQESGIVAALIAESNAGKTTTLSFIAGEVHPISIKSVIPKQKRLNIEQENVESIKSQFDQAQDKEQVYSVINHIGELEAEILDNYNLESSIDAYYVKPFIGHLAQDFSNVWMTMSCYDNVYFSLALRAWNQGKRMKAQEIKEGTLELLQQMDLCQPDVRSRRAYRLSGGMLRRLALCNAVASSPKLLLLDEISAGVDPVVKRKIWKCVQQIGERGDVSVILSTHDTSEIAEMAQTISIIDKGFSIVNNRSPFELRSQCNKYTVKFYNQSGNNNMILATEIKQQIENVNGVDTTHIDTLSPYNIQFIVEKNFSENEILQFCQMLQLICLRSDLDYTLSKAKLDEVYLDIIGFKREEYSESEIQSNSFLDKTKLEKVPKLGRMGGLFKKSLLNEFKHSFPIIAVFGFVLVVIGALFWWQSDMMDKIIRLTNQIGLHVSRQQDLAGFCFDQCLKHYDVTSDENITYKQKKLTQCLTERPDINAFNGKKSEEPQLYYKCGWYFTNLGLDYQYPYYIAIGDQRYNSMFFNSFDYSINQHQTATKVNEQLFFNISSHDTHYINSTIQMNDTLNYSEIYEKNNYTFDPSVNKINSTDNIGIIPYLYPKLYLQESSLNCSRIQGIETLCNQTNASNKFCPQEKNFDYSYCMNYTEKINCNEKDQQLHGKKSIYIINTTFLQHQKESYKYEPLDADTFEFDADSGLKADQLIGNRTILANFDFTQYDVKLVDNKLTGSIEILQSNYLPNRGSQGVYRNIQYHVNTKRINYTCNNTYSVTHNGKGRVRLLAMNGPHWYDSANTILTQSLPERYHTVLFDVNNEPQTYLVSGLLRKQMFQTVEEKNYTPWNSSYNLVNRMMSVVADPNYVKATPFSEAQLSQTIMQSMLVTTSLVIMMYVSMRYGREIESDTIRLLQFHFVSPSKWLLTELLFYILVSLILVAVNIVTIFIFLPDNFLATKSQLLNLPIYIMACLQNVVTGMVLALVLGKAKNAAVTSFFIMLFLTFFSFWLAGLKTFTYIVTVFIPSYAAQYQYFLQIMEKPVDLIMLSVSFLATVFWVIASLIIINRYHILAKIRQCFCKRNLDRQKAQIFAMESQEKLLQTENGDDETIIDIINTHQIYDTGTYALRGIDLKIPRGKIFGLLGSNGCGKSTLMNCLAGIYNPTCGQAIGNFDDGQVDLFMCSQVSKYFSVVPQHDIYWPNLTVRDHLDIMRRLNALPYKVDLDVLVKTLQLEECIDQYVDSLSGGVRRRVSIAMAMTVAPPLLALDEPSCGLGLTTKRFVDAAILRILNDNTTLVLTTHDMEEVEQLVDRCCIMNKGCVLKIGTVGGLRQRSRTGYILTLRESAENANLVAKKLNVSEVEYNSTCLTYILRVPQKTSELEILQKLKELNLLNTQWSVESNLIENIFMELVEQAEAQE